MELEIGLLSRIVVPTGKLQDFQVSNANLQLGKRSLYVTGQFNINSKLVIPCFRILWCIKEAEWMQNQ